MGVQGCRGVQSTGIGSREFGIWGFRGAEGFNLQGLGLGTSDLGVQGCREEHG